MDFTDKQKDVLRRLGTALTGSIRESAAVGQVFSDAFDAGFDILALHLNATVNLRRAAPEEIAVAPKVPGGDSLRLTISIYDPDTISLSGSESFNT